MLRLPRITVEVPVLSVGTKPADYEQLAAYADGLRRPQGLHMTLLHIGILEDFAADVADWTKDATDPASAAAVTADWLRSLPVLEGFSGTAERLVLFGGGRVSGLEVEVPQHVRDFQVSLVQALHELLDDLLVDNPDDFILSSRALGYRYPRWHPHVAVGKPKSPGYPKESHPREGRSRERSGSWEIRPLPVEFGPSQIRNGQLLPGNIEGLP
ncbi:hypothetical protein ACFVTE_19470 [Arthrobacter sp. NPDC058097]|uniref:hypothetical protein n=1 Tax=Arthrobacter sp. NPDC058097 TaxID=3346340 RepID=UPI0036D9D768